MLPSPYVLTDLLALWDRLDRCRAALAQRVHDVARAQQVEAELHLLAVDIARLVDDVQLAMLPNHSWRRWQRQRDRQTPQEKIG